MSVLIPKNGIILENLEFQVARADSGDPQLGPAILDSGGRRIGQLVVVVDDRAADDIRRCLVEEFGVWDAKQRKRVLNGTGSKHRK